MLYYLLILFLYLLFKDPTYLNRFLNNLYWLSGILYAKVRTSNIYNIMRNYLSNSNITQRNILIYISEKNMDILRKIDIKDVNIKDINYNKYYVRVPLKNNSERILIYNNPNNLLFNYLNLTESIEKLSNNFSNIMEATVNNLVVLPILNKYLNTNDNFYSLTGYNYIARDIYDFDSNKYLLEKDSILKVTNMKLQEYEFKHDNIIKLTN